MPSLCLGTAHVKINIGWQDVHTNSSPRIYVQAANRVSSQVRVSGLPVQYGMSDVLECGYGGWCETFEGGAILDTANS